MICEMCKRENWYLAQGFEWGNIVVLGDHTCGREDTGINPPPDCIDEASSEINNFLTKSALTD